MRPNVKREVGLVVRVCRAVPVLENSPTSASGDCITTGLPLACCCAATLWRFGNTVTKDIRDGIHRHKSFVLGLLMPRQMSNRSLFQRLAFSVLYISALLILACSTYRRPNHAVPKVAKG